MQSMAGVLRQNPQTTPNPLENTYGLFILDPNDSMHYNFDPATFNFENHSGALEFGMLGHMSSGVMKTASDDVTGPLSAPTAGYTTPGAISRGYDGSSINAQEFLYSPDHNLGEWQNDATRQPSGTQAFPLAGPHQVPLADMMPSDIFHGYTIGASPSSLTSSSSSPSSVDAMLRRDDEAHQASLYQSNTAHPNPPDASVSPEQALSMMSTPNPKAQSVSNRRTWDPSSIYDNVKQPYSYTAGFHGLGKFVE
jgi:hypothetical protein